MSNPAVLTVAHLHIACAIGERGLAGDLNAFQVAPAIAQLAEFAVDLNAIGKIRGVGAAPRELDAKEEQLNASCSMLCNSLGCEFQPLGKERREVAIMVPGEGGPDFWTL